MPSLSPLLIIPLLLVGMLFIIPTLWAIIAVALGSFGIFSVRHEKQPLHRPSDIYFPPRRKYRIWSARHGWSRASNLFYECGICHKSLSSSPTETATCGCGNLFIGPDHIGAQNPSKVRLYEEPA